MAKSHLPLNALRAFEAAARHLSLTRAADELSVSPGAISHQVRGLEALLGMKLFERHTRAIALTPAFVQSADSSRAAANASSNFPTRIRATARPAWAQTAEGLSSATRAYSARAPGSVHHAQLTACRSSWFSRGLLGRQPRPVPGCAPLTGRLRT